MGRGAGNLLNWRGGGGGGCIWSLLIVGNGISDYSQPPWLGLSLIVSL